MTQRFLPRLLATLLASLTLGTVQAEALSAPAAAAALAGGALAWDVRNATGAGSLPGAYRIDAASLAAWLERRDLPALQEAVSRAGLDLSRELVIYGEAGDARAQTLVASLQDLSRGRVHWLVGGAAEWAMSGRPLQAADTAPRLPVPQHLVSAVSAGSRTMAAAPLRATAPDALLAAR